MVKKPTIGLALGAGAARGIAHIGVLQVFQEHRIAIDFLAGTSIGAVIGGLFAAGMDLELLGKFVQELQWDDLVRLTVTRRGLVSSERIYRMLQVLTQDKTIEELSIPSAFVACDLRSGEEVVFRSGSAADAIRASLSIPGVFVPVANDRALLVDGAVVNRVPDNVVRAMGADIVIAVDLGFGPLRGNVRTLPDVIMRTIEILERQVEKHREHCADVNLALDLTDVGSTQLNRAGELIARGRDAAREHVAAIAAAKLRWQSS